MHKQTPQIHLELRPGAGLPRLRDFIQRAIDLSLFGLSTAESARVLPEPLAFASIGYQIGAQRSLEAVRGEFKPWLVAACLRDVVEALNEYLEVVAESCIPLEFLTDIPKSREDAEIRLAASRKGFNKLGLPAKLEKIGLMTHRAVIPISATHVLSINHSRNCLVHRLGFVSDVDTKAGACLIVSWLAYKAHVQSDADEQLVELPYVVGDGEVFVQQVVQTKSFSIGERIEFSAKELMEVCWTVFAFAEDLASNVARFASEMISNANPNVESL
jgi:hypothetical protein